MTATAVRIAKAKTNRIDTGSSRAHDEKQYLTGSSALACAAQSATYEARNPPNNRLSIV